jgi:putative SOS response-associated peptidase YedK
MPTSAPDNLPPGSDASSAHGGGCPGWVIRRNPKMGERHLDELVWGLLPQDTKNLDIATCPLNVRAETIVTHPMFASAFRDRRAIVPMSVYYQRSPTGGSMWVFAISPRDGEPMAVANAGKRSGGPAARSLAPTASS